MIIKCDRNIGRVRRRGFPVFDIHFIDLLQPPQEGLLFSIINVLEGSLGVPPLCCQEPPIVLVILAGAFVSATNPASFTSVHEAGLLTSSSSPPAANC